MKRSIIVCIVIALVAVFVPSHLAWADDPAPTKEQLEEAKKAFADGKAAFEAGKLPEAIEKFKTSYRLSRNPTLLYNIGFTLDQADQKDKALFYYRKFLADAPKTAPQRKEVTKRVDAIEKENLESDLAGTSTPTGGGGAPPMTKPTEVRPPVKLKPAGTYSEKDFQHQMVESAPPGKPLDVTAFVPEDSGFSVTLYYRGGGEAKFVSKPMKWRYKELVGRIPAAKLAGSSIQYYLEVKDQAGTVVTRSGKSTSPNLVNIEAGASPRFYPDLTDDGEQAITPTQQKHRDESEDPLGKGGQVVDPEAGGGGGIGSGGGVVETPVGPPGTGFTDVGSSKFGKAKWASTITAGALLSGAVVTYILAKQQASNLVTDSQDCNGSPPPCRVFDLEYDAEVQKAGKRYNTIHQVTSVLGVGAAAVAGYFWYRQLTAKKHGELKVTTKNNSPETTWAITPSLGDGFTGAAAAVGF